MRIAYATGRADDFGIDNWFVVIQCLVSITVFTNGISHSFFINVITGEVNK